MVSHRVLHAHAATTTRHHVTMGKKKNDFKVSDISVKKEAWLNRVPLAVEMVRLMNEK
jgi:hypothetical protein